MRIKSTLLLACALLVSSSTFAQNTTVHENDTWCKEDKSSYRYNGKRSYKHCEVREITLSGNRDLVKIDGQQNGGVQVQAWDKNEILIRAKVQSWSKSKDEAYDLAQKVTIETRRTIEANSPKTSRRDGVSVSYDIYVPKNSNLDIETHNGGVAIADVSGEINFKVLNGGAKLVNLSGDVTGRTTNGGLKIQLEGTEWAGEKMDVQTTNGGVVLYVPQDYNAQLHTGTVNGGIDLDFPVNVRGSLRRNMNVTLGNGGKNIKATTINGGVKVKRSNGALSLLKK